MVYRESLPGDCPPEEAASLEQITTFYRLVKALPPNENDFDSRWQERPDLREKWEREDKVCEAKGVSLFTTPESAWAITKWEEHRNKMVCQVNVTPQCGPAKQTSSNHYAWWPLRDCNVLDLCPGYTP